MGLLAEVPVPSLLNKQWIRDSEWLTMRVDRWISRCQGYNKLKNSSRSQSEEDEDKNDLPERNWNGLLRNKVLKNDTYNPFKNVEHFETGHLNPPSHQNTCKVSEELAESPNRHSVKIQTSTKPNSMCCQNIKCEMTVDNAHFNHTVEVNDNYETCAPVSHTEIRIAVNNKVISSVELDYQNDKNGNREENISAKSKFNCENCASENCNEDYAEDGRGSLDKHRKLIQIMATPIRKLGKHVVPEDRNRKEFQHPISEVVSWRQASNELRSFLSFRHHNNNKTNQRKRHVVVGGTGTNDPVWPSVLLTFERGVSKRPDSPHSILACQENKQR